MGHEDGRPLFLPASTVQVECELLPFAAFLIGVEAILGHHVEGRGGGQMEVTLHLRVGDVGLQYGILRGLGHLVTEQDLAHQGQRFLADLGVGQVSRVAVGKVNDERVVGEGDTDAGEVGSWVPACARQGFVPSIEGIAQPGTPARGIGHFDVKSPSDWLPTSKDEIHAQILEARQEGMGGRFHYGLRAGVKLDTRVLVIEQDEVRRQQVFQPRHRR